MAITAFSVFMVLYGIWTHAGQTVAVSTNQFWGNSGTYSSNGFKLIIPFTAPCVSNIKHPFLNSHRNRVNFLLVHLPANLLPGFTIAFITVVSEHLIKIDEYLFKAYLCGREDCPHFREEKTVAQKEVGFCLPEEPLILDTLLESSSEVNWIWECSEPLRIRL